MMETFSPLAEQFAACLRRLHPEAPEVVLELARQACEAVAQGHVCLDLAAGLDPLPSPKAVDLSGAKPDPAGEGWVRGSPNKESRRVAELLRLDSTTLPPGRGREPEGFFPGVIGAPGEYTPMILDGTRLYLARYWHYETRLAQHLQQRAAFCPDVDVPKLRRDLDRLFAHNAQQPDWQRVAAAAAVLRRFSVISGGPGTGKTTTVIRILAALQSQAGGALRMGLAAPTGKAAARMQDAIRGAKQGLDFDADLLAVIPENALTLHRLLGSRPDSVYFRHDAEHPLPLDVLVVDEASMIDLALMAKLLDALPPTCRLILLGDKDQLASVEAGAVFGDICGGGEYSGEFLGLLERAGAPVRSPSPAGGESEARGAQPGRGEGGEDSLPRLFNESTLNKQKVQTPFSEDTSTATAAPSPRAAAHPSPAYGRGVDAPVEYVPEPPAALPEDIRCFARELRQSQTDAEELFWLLLRNRRLLGLKFRRQHPIGRYILDFYCAERQIAIELDGGQHAEQAAYDSARDAFLKQRGIQVLRFWNNQVLTETEAVLEAIYLALTESAFRSPSPVDGRGVRGEGGDGYDPRLFNERALDKQQVQTPFFEDASSATAAPSLLADSIMLLRHSHRFAHDSGIGALARLFNDGQAEAALALLAQGADGIVWRQGRFAQFKDDLLRRMEQGYAGYFDAVAVGDAAAALAAFNRFRVLTAHREGDGGAENLNLLLEERIKQRRNLHYRTVWYPGRAVMISRNDYNLRLFNGDIGIALEEGGQLRVFFEDADGRIRGLAPGRLPEHRPVYAMTVHKSQGSEFDQVLLVLPDQAGPVLNRPLAYTAVTRAKRRAEIWGLAETLTKALEALPARASGLRGRLWGE